MKLDNFDMAVDIVLAYVPHGKDVKELDKAKVGSKMLRASKQASKQKDLLDPSLNG